MQKTHKRYLEHDAGFESRLHAGWPSILYQWLSDQRVAAQQRPVMGVFKKVLLVPVPFCLATVVSLTFWNLGLMTGMSVLGGITAVLAYIFILLLLLLRLVFPIHHTPLLSFKQKLVSLPIILASAIFAGWFWLAMVDHAGTISNQWGLCVWCGLIGITCATLAYL